MPAARSRSVTITIVLAAAVAALALGVDVVAPPQPAWPAGSSYSTASDGTAAAFRTLSALGYHVVRSADPLTSLAEPPASTLLVLAQPVEGPSEQDRRALRTFVAAGGTVLTTGCGGASFLGAGTAAEEDPFAAERTYHAALLSPLTVGAPAITIAAGCSSGGLGAGFLPLYIAGGLAGARYVRAGAGTEVWLSSDTPLTNAAIASERNLDLLLNVAGVSGRTVIWGEYYHGQRRSLWSFTAGTPLRWACAQVALLLGIAAATYARRRMPVRARSSETRTSPLEFVETMASLYARAPSAADAVAVACARLRRLLFAATGQTPNATDDALAMAAASRLRTTPAELAALLESARAAASQSSTTADEALPLVRKMQALAAAIGTGGEAGWQSH